VFPIGYRVDAGDAGRQPALSSTLFILGPSARTVPFYGVATIGSLIALAIWRG
jgi:hypothetical protein